MRKLKLVTIFILMCFFNATAQQSYVFSIIPPGTFPYEELSNDSLVVSFAPNNVFEISELYGETFNFFGTNFTFGPYAMIAMGVYSSMTVANDTSLVIIDIANAPIDSIDSTSRKSYSIQGLSGDRILKLQYKNYKFTSGPPGNYANFQLWYFQHTGVIEFHYGSRSNNNASGYSPTNGPQIGMFFSRGDFTECFEKIWVKGTPTNPVLDSTSSYSFNAMSGLPDSGTVIRFTPKPVSTLRVEENSFETPILLPNPVKDFLRIDNVTAGKNSVEIYNTVGVKVYETMLNQSHELYVGDLAEGIYLIKITPTLSQPFVKRIQILK